MTEPSANDDRLLYRTEEQADGPRATFDALRLDAVERTGLLDSDRETYFDRAVRLATRLLDTPVSLFSVVDRNRQFFKAQVGLAQPVADARETPLTHSFCQHVVDRGEPLVVEDARDHPLVSSNLAIRDLDVISYLGVPVRTTDGYVVGSFCAIGSEPRTWTAEDIATLHDVAAGVESEMNLRVALSDVKTALDEKDVLLREVEHRVKNLFSLVPAIVALSARGTDDKDELATVIGERVAALSRSHALTVNAFSENKGIVFDAMIRAVLEPYEDQSDSFQLDGPPVRLPSSAGNAVALALHELATNAVKYGSLSKAKGRITIRWRLIEESEDRTILHFTWIERGGPPVSGVPERQGFGTRLIDRLLQSQDGIVRRDWHRDGLTVTLDLPFDKSDWADN